jgi:hypothetical protein
VPVSFQVSHYDRVSALPGIVNGKVVKAGVELAQKGSERSMGILFFDTAFLAIELKRKPTLHDSDARCLA